MRFSDNELNVRGVDREGMINTQDFFKICIYNFKEQSNKNLSL